MAEDKSRCDADRLTAFLDDRLSEAVASDVIAHLDECRRCRHQLESLAGSPGWWSDAREFLAGVSLAAGDAHDPAAPGSPAVRGAAGCETQRPESPDLGFLAWSENPAMLGRLGEYEVAEVIGSGGMGIVLKGFDAALNRYVAIKVLSPQWAQNAAARCRFEREGRAAAAVVHEHVVAIYTVVDESGGLPYLVMPYMPGGSLRQRIEGAGPLEVREILRIGMQVAAGLAAAHAQGLVHRDVKPANILLEKGVERVMISDFGLARAADDASLTQSGVIAGTPDYMAPEQAEGKAVDHRADLFSLGSVMYAMCTGRAPFRAEPPLAVLRRICDGAPRPIREVNPDVPDWLEAIVGKLHAKDPAERFQTAGELADLLGKHLAHLQQPTVVPMPPRVRRPAGAARFVPLGRVGRAMALVGCVVVAGLGVSESLGITALRHVFTSTGSSVARVPAPRPVVFDVDAWQADLKEVDGRLQGLEREWLRDAREPTDGRWSTSVGDLQNRLRMLEGDPEFRDTP